MEHVTVAKYEHCTTYPLVVRVREETVGFVWCKTIGVILSELNELGVSQCG